MKVSPIRLSILGLALVGCKVGEDPGQPGPAIPAPFTTNTAICDSTQPGFDTRPLWSEVPDKPDYERISTNINAHKSLRLLATTVNKAVSKVDSLRSELEKVKATGTCNCKGDEEACDGDQQTCKVALNPPVPRDECHIACADLKDRGVCGATGEVVGWQMDDLYFGPRNVARKALEQVGWLDKVVEFITSDDFGNALKVAGQVGGKLKNISDFADNTFAKVDQFTEGFHIGAYSEDRPDLWYCVPRAGSGVYSSMGNLGGGRFSIGTNYFSGLPAKKVHGGFSLGGTALEANGKIYPLLPSMAYNVQIDGFRMFDKTKLFGFPISPGQGLSVETANQLDVFNLVDNNSLASIAGNDGAISWLDLLYRAQFPVDYKSHVDGQTYTWPREGIDNSHPLDVSKANFGAGLDMKLEMERKVWNLPSIPIAGVATLTLQFTLDAGLAWHNQHNRMLNRVTKALGVEGSALKRDMHAMQADDASRDVGVTAHVDPRVAAELLLGVKLGKFAKLGIFANVGLQLSMQPGFFADTVDTSSALSNFLNTINPPVDASCDPIIKTPPAKLVCKNSFAVPNSELATEIAKLACDPLASGCTQKGLCKFILSARESSAANAAAIPELTEEECTRRNGVWEPHQCVSVAPPSEVVGWQGPGCNPLSPVGDGYVGLNPTQSAALQSAMQNQQAPLHSIFTYALSDLTFTAILDAAVRVGLEIKFKLFGRTIEKSFSLFNWSDAWNLGSTNKTWLQKGLEAQYQEDCAAPGAVMNHQPHKVKRYPNASSPAWDKFNDSDELIDNWCYASLPEDQTYGQLQVGTNDSIVSSVNGYSEMGADMGTKMWEQNQVCVGGQLVWDWLAERVEGEQCSVIDAATSLQCERDPYTCNATNKGESSCEHFGACYCEAASCSGFPLGVHKLHDKTEQWCYDNGPVTTFIPYACVERVAGSKVVATADCSATTTLLGYSTGCLVPNDPTAPTAQAAWLPNGAVDVERIFGEDGQLVAPYTTAAWQLWAEKFASCVERSDKGLDVKLSCAVTGDCKPEACCGDGVKAEHEACDASAVNAPANCSEHCSLITCGDGRREGSEECDDGNINNLDGCSATCKKTLRPLDEGRTTASSDGGSARLGAAEAPADSLALAASEAALAKLADPTITDATELMAQYTGTNEEGVQFTACQAPVEITSVKLWFKAFIPKEVEGVMMARPNHPGQTGLAGPAGSECFTGDHRSFSSDIAATARMHIETVATLGDFPSLGSNVNYCSESHEYNCETGDHIGSKTGTVNGGFTKIEKDTKAPYLYRIYFSSSASNPLVALSPAIDMVGVVTVNTWTGLVTYDGKVDEFPAFEGYVEINGVQKPLLRSNPPAGNTPLSLFGDAILPRTGAAQFPVPPRP